MKVKKIKVKKLTMKERQYSFPFIAPTSGILKPLTHSNDVIMRRKDMGIGFVLDDFKEDLVISPIDGIYLETINSSFGVVILNTQHQVYVVVNFTGEKDYEINQGVEILPQIIGSKIKQGDPIIKIDREYLKWKNYTFQITLSFSQYLQKINTKNKYDILYTFKDKIKRGDTLGWIYKVDENKVIDLL